MISISKQILALSLTAAAGLSACGGSAPIDNYSYKTANPYGLGPYRGGIATVDQAVQPYQAAQPVAEEPAYVPPQVPFAQAAQTPGTTTTNMLFTMSKSGGTANVDGEKVTVQAVGKPSGGISSYMVLFGMPTQLSKVDQPGIATQLVAGMTSCSITTPAQDSSGDVLSAISGTPKDRYVVRAKC